MGERQARVACYWLDKAGIKHEHGSFNAKAKRKKSMKRRKKRNWLVMLIEEWWL